MSIETTELQAAYVDGIKKFILENGKSPTVREMCVMFGQYDENGVLVKALAPNAVQQHLNRLIAKGILTGGEGKSRSYRIVGWNPFGGESQTSRVGENYAVNFIGGNRVAFMIFSDAGMVESGVYEMAAAVKMADQLKVDASLAVLDRLVKVAEWIAKKKVKVTA